ncbi:glucosyltransferase domain-containing protein [Candidatus Saccharibacteria bacterium]|nr:glucosyltransferase domain-containing protein [Candidatus Saccharibacteria bacterium]
MEKVKKLFNENRFLTLPILWMFLIYLVGALAIIFAGVHFADDIARTNYGYAGWNGFSRYLTTVLAHIFHADGYLTNIAPLPQVLALLILAVASVLLICLVTGKDVFKKPKWWWYLVAAVPLGLSPYMLECLAYQYDAPYMAISVLFAILPVLFRKSRKWVYGLAILIGVLVVCMTYQAAIGILPMVVLFVAMREWNEDGKLKNKENWKYIGFSAVVFIVSLVLFQMVLMKPRDAYVSNSLPEIQNLVPEFFEHLGQYFSLVFSDLKVWWLVLIGLILVGFVVLFVVRSKRNKVGALAVAVLGGLAIIVLAFAFYAVLDKPLYATRAMYPLGVAIAIFAIYVMSGEKKAWVLKIPVVVISYCFVVFALTFGNALKEQDNYRSMVMEMVVADLNDLPEMQDGTTKFVQASGNVGFSPVVLHMPRDYNILQRLLMPTFSEYVPWMAYQVLEESGLPLVYDEQKNISEMNLPKLKETILYNIYGDKEHILVEFKGENPFNLIF